MSAETLLYMSACLCGASFPVCFFLESRWKYFAIIGMLLSFIIASDIGHQENKRRVYHKFYNLTKDTYVYITGNGNDAYRIDLSNVTPGCNLIVYKAFDYHLLYYFPPKVLLIEPIKCGDRVANQASIAYNGAE